MAGVRRVTGLLLCIFTLAYVLSGDCRPTPVCDPSDYTTSPNPPIPDLPRQFSAVIEANFVQLDQSALVREYFDEIGNRGRFEIAHSSSAIVGIFDYNLGEVFLIPDPNTGDGCSVHNLIQSSLSFFGFRIVNGSVHIGTVGRFFRLSSNVSANYLGQEDVRGIVCDHWQTCTVMENKSYTLDYYFSTADWAFSANPNGSQIPVQVMLNESQSATPNLYHIYSFVDFVSGPQSVPDKVFMVPTGLPCRGRIPGQPLPALPNFFTVYLETVSLARQTARYAREFYDFSHQLFRVDINPNGSEPISVIQDFNNKVQYIIFKQYTNCSITPITITSPLTTDLVSDNGVPHLRSLSGLLLQNDQFNYSYEGITNVRGVDVDSWVSIRDFQKFPYANVTDGLYEVFFTRPGWTINSLHTVTTEPILWRAKLSGMFSFINFANNSTVSERGSFVFDFFDASGDEPGFDAFDTSVCLPPSEYQIITMVIPGQENGLDLSRLRRAVRKSVSDYTQVQPLQVGSIEIIGENGTHIFVTFHIANLTRFATPPSSSTNVTANQAVLYIISNLASNGALPFSVALNSNTNVTPIFLNVSQHMSQPPPQGSCIHYSYPQQVMNCLTFANCSGAQCTYQGGHASFIVHKCQDPVTVDLRVVTSWSSFQQRFYHSDVANVSASWSYVDVRMLRNATHLYFQVTAIIGNITMILIPSVTIPLNPSMCMCQSLYRLARDIQSPRLLPIQYSCTNNTACSGVHCQFSNYTCDVTFDPCSERVQLTAHNPRGSVVYQKIYNSSRSETIHLPSDLSQLSLGSTAILNVTILHHNYSMEIEISLIVNTLFGPRVVEILSHHIIILDKSNCSSNATSLPPPTSSPPTPSPTSSQTCMALRNLTFGTHHCNTTHSCTTVECKAQGYHTMMTVLPCHIPTAFRLIIHDSTGEVVYNETLTRSQNVSIHGMAVVNVTIDHVSDKIISVEMDILTLDQSVTLLPRTTIYIDHSHCPGYFHSTTHTDMHTTPTQTMLPSNNCLALNHMTEFLKRNASFVCEFSATCDRVNCSQRGVTHVALILLSCHSPPSFILSFGQGGYVESNHTFTRSEELPLSSFPNVLQNATLNVTLNHISDSTIEVEVDFTREDTAALIIIPRTVVQLDRSGCLTTQHTATPLAVSQGSQLVVAVVTPLGAVLCLIVLVVVIVVVILKCRRASQYQFQWVKLKKIKADPED